MLMLLISNLYVTSLRSTINVTLSFNRLSCFIFAINSLVGLIA